MLDFGVLGVVELRRDGVQVGLRAPMMRRLLAVLLVQAGEPISPDQLIEMLWDGRPPRTARKTLHAYVCRLRGLLDENRLVFSQPAGYSLIVADGELDVHRFDQVSARARHARAAGALDKASAHFAQALGLWRGMPYADIGGIPLVADEASRLEEQKQLAVEEQVGVELDLGRHVESVPELTRLSHVWPYRERLRALLMLALYRGQRRADALDIYRQTRVLLADELGVEPLLTVQRLHEAILRDDPRLATLTSDRLDTFGTEPARRSSAAARTVVPAQLPPDTASFTGRADELAELDTLLPKYATTSGAAVVISAIAGTGGVGKTALAVRWAHRAADRFPDGQLYVNLRGYGPGERVQPSAALGGFLRSLGIEGSAIPQDVDERAALYRSLLAGKRMLVVLDNARAADQVRPLLPGSPTCLVVITSRDDLAGLVARDGAHRIRLDVLSDDEARALLRHILGRERVDAEPNAVNELIRRSDRLPLALRLIAERASRRQQTPLSDLAAELADEAGRLDLLDAGGDPATAIRAVLSWSYNALPDDAARLFRLIGLHPGPEIAILAAASLAGISVEQVRPLLTDLTRAHLLIEHTPGRYTLHDLVRAYATELSHASDSENDRRSAVRRMLDHYLHTAHAAALLLNPHRDPITLAPTQPGVTLVDLDDYGQAMAWLTTEHAVLLSAIRQAAGVRYDVHAWQLAWTLTTFLNRQGHWHDAVTTQRTALDAAHRLGDRLAQVHAHHGLGLAYDRLGRRDGALTHLRHAVEAYADFGDHTGEASAHLDISRVLEVLGRHGDALVHDQKALYLYRAAGDLSGQARALNHVGWDMAQLGDHLQALVYCQQAHSLVQEVGDLSAEAATWDSLGYANYHLGHHAQAITCYQQALELCEELGDRYHQADTLASLGNAHYAVGDHNAASDAWHSALTILDELGHPKADEVRTKLLKHGD